MCSLLRLLPLAALVATSAAQPAAAPPPPSARESALDSLLSERDSEPNLTKLIETARKSGVSEQAILEARFLFHVDRREDDAIAAMLPEFLKRRDSFALSESAIFSVKEDWLAVIEYVQAIAALKKQDKDGFKSHILEAFWLSPRQASAFAPQIERLRLEEAMSRIKVPFDAPFPPLSGGDPQTLAALATDKKAVILHFWNPASRECQDSMPDYVATATALSAKGIAMVSVLPEADTQVLTDARKLVAPLGPNPPGAWIVDRKQDPLARMLRIQTYPQFVLVSSSGTILFNGDPSDDVLWERLSKIDAGIVRPEAPKDDQ